MAVAHDEATMQLIKSRLSNPERSLIRVLRSFYKLATLPNDDHDELYMSHATFLLELHSFTRSLSESRGTKMIHMTGVELGTLSEQKSRLEGEAMKERERIVRLEAELEEARRERRNKIQYEEIGKEVRRFSDRVQSAELVNFAKLLHGFFRRISGLIREIDSLLEEQGLYAERWASRRVQFDTVISNLEVLQESIREEKADADRKNALNDDESDVENPEETDPSRNEAEAETETEAAHPSGALNPNVPSFVPNPLADESTEDSTLDGRPINDGRDSENARPAPSSETTCPDDQMEVDQLEGGEVDVEASREEGLVLDNGTMEDGEEIEEAEEGQEMEHD